MADVALPDTAEAGDFEAFVAVDASRLTDGQLIDRLLLVQRMRARLDAATVAVTDRFDAGLIGAADGARTTAAWVSQRVGISYGYARADVELARALRGHHPMAAAHAEGRLTRDQVKALLKVRGAGLEDAFDACEPVLVDELATCTLSAGQRFLARWAQEVRERFGIAEPDGPDPGCPGGRSRAHLSPVGDRWRGDLDLSAEDGERVANAIDAQIDAMWHQGVFTAGDGLEPAERRAIALVEVIERGTRGGDEDGIARPLVLGLLPMDHLTGTAPDAEGAAQADDDTGGCSPRDAEEGDAAQEQALGPAGTDPSATPRPDAHDALAGLDPLTPFPAAIAAELSRSGPVHPEVLRRLACEGAVIPVYVGPGADQLTMGRTIRIANRTQRRALRIRDGGCQFPGCSVPPEHCIAHHMIWWDHGGRTDIQNLVLLCRFHHRAVHGGGFTIGRDPDRTITTRRTDRHPFTAPLRPRTPLIPPRPPPGPLGEDETPEERDEAYVLARARFTDLIRRAKVKRATTDAQRAHDRPPSDTTILRQ